MWGEKIKFVCKMFRTEHAQIFGYPLEYPWLMLSFSWIFDLLDLIWLVGSRIGMVNLESMSPQKNY